MFKLFKKMYVYVFKNSIILVNSQQNKFFLTSKTISVLKCYNVNYSLVVNKTFTKFKIVRKFTYNNSCTLFKISDNN